MFRKDYILFPIFFVVMFYATSCDKGQGDPEPSVHDHVLVQHIMTKGSGNGNVYRLGLKGIAGTQTEEIYVTALYRDTYEGSPLEPLLPDVNGDYIPNSEGGLRAKSGDYKMFIVYPPKEEKPVEYDGFTDKTGYKVTRVGSLDFTGNTETPETKDIGTEDEENDFYFSELMDVTLDGVYLGLKNNPASYIYDASSMPLKQKRSRITVSFSCGEEILSVNLKSISVNNVIPEGYYNPAENVFYYREENLESINFFNSTDPEGKLVEAGSSMPVGDVQYILSMNYNEKDALGQSRWVQPELCVELIGAKIDLTFPLAIDFLPQYEYALSVTVNSADIVINLNASPWDNVSADATITYQQSWTIDIEDEDWIDKEIVDAIG